MSFMTRDQLFERLLKKVDGFKKGFRQNVGLLGVPGSGKSYLLGHLYDRVKNDPETLPVYFRADVLTFDQFVYQWIGTLLNTVHPDLQELYSIQSKHIEHLDQVVPKTMKIVKHIRQLMRQGKHSLVTKELFSIPGQLAEETGKKLVLMIDHFEAMENLYGSDPFSFFGRHIMVEKDILYIVTCSNINRGNEILKNKLSLLFSQFEIFELRPFGFYEMTGYLKTQFPHFSFSFPIRKFLFRLTNGEPYYLDLILNRLEGLLVTGDSFHAMSPAHMMEAVCQELMNDYGRLYLIFEKKIESCGKFQKDINICIHVLLAMAAGKNKLKTIALHIERKSADVKRAIQHLCDIEMVEKFGGFYEISDHLFRFWLKVVYRRKTSLFSPDDSPIRKDLFAQLKSLYEICHSDEENIEYLQPLFEDLLKSFRNDRVHYNEKALKLPAFTEIYSKDTHGEGLAFFAKTSQGKWVFRICVGKVTEDDVLEMSNELKKLRKVQKRILIPLAGMDQNAKLLAQTQRMDIWESLFVNHLLDVYHMNKVILEQHHPSMELSPKNEVSNVLEFFAH